MKELILIGIFIIAFILNLLGVNGATILLILSGGTLAMIYFYISVIIFNKIPLKSAFKKAAYKDIPTSRILGSIGGGIALSVLIIGLLFTIMNWPGGRMQLATGIVLSTILLLVSLVKFFTKKVPFYKLVIIRSALWVVFGTVLFLLPPYTLINIKYSDNPAYRDALINSMENPNDSLIHQKWVEESKKLNE